jgi:hypothetical protein
MADDNLGVEPMHSGNNVAHTSSVFFMIPSVLSRAFRQIAGDAIGILALSVFACQGTR